MTIWIRRAALAALIILPFALASTAAAASTDEAELAARFAPVVRLVNQPQNCGPGDPYVPIDVNLLFDEPTVALRGPWGPNDLVKVAPSADDLAGGLYDYHLDFPGNALDPGCTYLDWSRRLTQGHSPTVYAHVSTDPGYPGQLALQYWMFYVFNDWNNLHEGDWEMIQLNFHASDAAQALHETPSEVGYSQHEGAERSAWDDPKLQLVGGTHPVVYPADGSHANFYDEALYLGASGSQGVGCDDTRNAGLVTHPAVQTIPGDPSQAAAGFPWIGFVGPLGRAAAGLLQRADRPQPEGAVDGADPLVAELARPRLRRACRRGGGNAHHRLLLRRHGRRVAAAGAGGQRPVADHRGVLAALALVAYGLRRATWRPTAPLRLAHRRAWGQILSAAARMYASRLRLFIGIGVLILPVSVAITILQAIVLHASSLFGIEVDGEAAGTFVLVVVAIGTALTLLGLGVMQAATALAMIELDEGRSVRPIRAYRMALRRLWPVLGAIVIAVVVDLGDDPVPVPDPARYLAGGALGAGGAGGRARGSRPAGGDPAQQPAGARGLAEGGVADDRQRRHHAGAWPADRDGADRVDQHAAGAAEPDRRRRLHADDAVHRAHHHVRLPGHPGRRGAARPQPDPSELPAQIELSAT